jgi:hypothetical protein
MVLGDKRSELRVFIDVLVEVLLSRMGRLEDTAREVLSKQEGCTACHCFLKGGQRLYFHVACRESCGIVGVQRCAVEVRRLACTGVKKCDVCKYFYVPSLPRRALRAPQDQHLLRFIVPHITRARMNIALRPFARRCAPLVLRRQYSTTEEIRQKAKLLVFRSFI